MVKVANWNIRGLNVTSKRKEVRRLILENGLDICSIVETKVCRDKLRPICEEIFGNWMWVTNNAVCDGRTRIIIGWDTSKVNVDVVAVFNQVIHVHICQIETKRSFHCSFIYAANDVISRRRLWDQLLMHKGVVNLDPWVALGDFNVSLNPSDSSRGSSVVSVGMQDFRDCINGIEMEDINQKGLEFTWTQKPLSDVGGKGLLKKLDRVFGNPAFIEAFPTAFATFLPYGLSDHSPAVLSLPSLSKVYHKPFKFNNHLVNNPEFIPKVVKGWRGCYMGCCMFSLVSKLKDVKKELRKLDLEHGNVFTNVKKLRVEIGCIQSDIDCDPENGDLRKDGAIYLKAFKDALIAEETFLRQRAKIQWLREGDANTAYFHSVVRSKMNRGWIEEIEDMDGMRFMGSAVVG